MCKRRWQRSQELFSFNSWAKLFEDPNKYGSRFDVLGCLDEEGVEIGLNLVRVASFREKLKSLSNVFASEGSSDRFESGDPSGVRKLVRTRVRVAQVKVAKVQPKSKSGLFRVSL